jgi:DNA-binding MarR family transcriptional regulator
MIRSSSNQDDWTRTVTFSAHELRHAVHLLQVITGVDEHSLRGKTSNPHILANRARQAFLERRRRIAIFGAGMFGESAWDMLLILYVEKDAQRQSIRGLAELAGIAKSTALRWLKALEARGFVQRTKHPTDLRTDFVELTEKGERALDSYFSETLTTMR